MSDHKFPLLWYTSGTPITVGQRDCAMARYLEFHAGTHGTGFKKRATAVPLATGAAVHQGIELIGRWLLEKQAKMQSGVISTVPDEVIAWAALEAAARYESKARARGLQLTNRDVDSAAASDRLILEQRTLIEAQVWIYALVRLPYMLSEYRILDVEREEDPVIDCTCGLGDWVASAPVHAARGCRGIVAQGKADFLWEQITTGTIAYEEFKTKAMPNYGWDQSWEHSGQLYRNMTAASARLGRDVSVAFVPVLYKGKRDRRDRDDKTQPKEQQSPLVYGYFDPGNGMTRMPEWAARYKWYDDWGNGHTLPRTYQRQPIWDEAIELPAENPNGWPGRAGASRVERWVRGWILPVQWSELLKVLGPFPKPAALLDDYTAAMLTEERDWRERVGLLRANDVFVPGEAARIDLGAGAPVQTFGVEHVISRSWNCTRFDGTSCMFKPVCLREPGWQSLQTMTGPDGGLVYEIRTPHHDPEKAAFEALGIVFPEQDDDDGGEE